MSAQGVPVEGERCFRREAAFNQRCGSGSVHLSEKEAIGSVARKHSRMSDRTELLAILLSGFFPPLQRNKTEIGSCRSVSEYVDSLDVDAGLNQERSTVRLLRLVGGHGVRPTRF